MISLEADTQYQFLAKAKGYICSAEVLVHEKNSSSLYRAPILHLLCHGIELFLKYSLVRSGASLYEARLFGHNIEKIWNEPRITKVKIDAKYHAWTAWENAKNSGDWEDDFSEDPSEILNEYIKVLSSLHSKETDYALRYYTDPSTQAPKPFLLIETFLPLIESALFSLSIKNSNSLRSAGESFSPAPSKDLP